MQIDVGAAADVAGQRAADQPGPEGLQDPHHAEGLQAHVAEVFGPPIAFAEVAPKTWIWSRISRLLGRSLGLKSPRVMRRAALSFARKYSVSSRSYISRAASQATWRRILSLDILWRRT